MEEDIVINYNNVNLQFYQNLVLSNLNIQVTKGSFVYLIGSVGSGKSTFLKSLYADVPIHSGEASILDYDLVKIKNNQIPYLRREVGIVFQDFKLLIDRTIHQNLEFVLKSTGWNNQRQINARIDEVLKHVGMENKSYKMPHELSGGEQQRASIARSLLNSPSIILADEPTGNLDPSTGSKIVELLHEISQNGTTVLMSTHNYQAVKKYSGKILKFEDGNMKEVVLATK